MMAVLVLTYSMGSIIAEIFAGKFDPLLLSMKTGKWEKLAGKALS
ncbi:hypothetical protein GNIT_2534 [Glaciecola nitratireducens FR1064]|uniref:Uncharacterized protein n=1 Tax=Glaciecola nitratireducens (strain JCM 12485 / KCTC 12276 / FR1064) TaxID=1085623 RepID=G4QM60_GLANF|nr:hypothetical protein GNIT_2534 [Glaciecola nitratireducens FR1064]